MGWTNDFEKPISMEVFQKLARQLNDQWLNGRFVTQSGREWGRDAGGFRIYRPR
jgi:hypothetical protein